MAVINFRKLLNEWKNQTLIFNECQNIPYKAKSLQWRDVFSDAGTGRAPPQKKILLISQPYSDHRRIDYPQPLLLAPSNFFTFRHH